MLHFFVTLLLGRESINMIKGMNFTIYNEDDRSFLKTIVYLDGDYNKQPKLVFTRDLKDIWWETVEDMEGVICFSKGVSVRIVGRREYNKIIKNGGM